MTSTPRTPPTTPPTMGPTSIDLAEPELSPTVVAGALDDWVNDGEGDVVGCGEGMLPLVGDDVERGTDPVVSGRSVPGR